MTVEPTVGQSRSLHHIGDRRRCYSVFPKHPGGDLDDARAGLGGFLSRHSPHLEHPFNCIILGSAPWPNPEIPTPESSSPAQQAKRVFQLLEKGYPVRAFVRRRDQRADALAKAGAEIFEGDQYALNDMRRAMTGVQRAYERAPITPSGLHFNAVFAAAAYEAELEHVVTLGQWLSAANHPSLFTREVYLSDILIRMSPRTSVTSVNPGWFADNYLMVLDMAAHLGLFTMPLGDGDTKKNAPPSNEDIASVAAAALIDPQTHAGKTYRPTGPELLSPNEIASAMGRAMGRKVKYMDIPERRMVKALKALPPSNYSEAALPNSRSTPTSITAAPSRRTPRRGCPPRRRARTGGFREHRSTQGRSTS
ncbi:NmrA family NAD(P)-binding protein [Ciceribacter ferrooxidans]|uniref:NmrA family NAD(P)-binding protein n=1 Tax=Ciceribacter ferrooxidans TaxID=2509717 RepID=UPI0034E064AA